jgi:hypothetical protein
MDNMDKGILEDNVTALNDVKGVALFQKELQEVCTGSGITLWVLKKEEDKYSPLFILSEEGDTVTLDMVLSGEYTCYLPSFKDEPAAGADGEVIAHLAAIFGDVTTELEEGFIENTGLVYVPEFLIPLPLCDNAHKLSFGIETSVEKKADVVEVTGTDSSIGDIVGIGPITSAQQVNEPRHSELVTPRCANSNILEVIEIKVQLAYALATVCTTIDKEQEILDKKMEGLYAEKTAIEAKISGIDTAIRKILPVVGG